MKCKALAKSGNHFSPFQRAGCQKLIKTRIPEISRFGLLETSPKKLLKLLFVLFFLCWLSSVQFGRQAAQAIFSPSDFALFQLVGWRRQTRARQKLQHDQPDALSGGLHSLRLSKDTGGTGTGRPPAKVGTSQTTGYPMTTPMLGFTPNFGQITKHLFFYAIKAQ